METTTTPTPKRSKQRYFVIGLFSFMILFMVGFVSLFVIIENPPFWMVKKIAALDFPKSAKLLNSHGRFFQETDIWAKIEIDKADVEPFIKSLPQSSPISEGDRYRVLKYLTWEWWNPDSAKKSKFICIQKTGEGFIIKRHYIFIDLDDSKKAIIYLWYLSD